MALDLTDDRSFLSLLRVSASLLNRKAQNMFKIYSDQIKFKSCLSIPKARHAIVEFMFAKIRTPQI